MNAPLHFSIVTPSYDQLDYLRCCAQSVADQTGDLRFEHLIQEGLGGGSFLEWASSQNRACVCVEGDSGMYDAINRGFAKSKGAVLAWLNCDEQYLPGTLSKVWQWFEKHPDCDILFGDTVLISKDGCPLAYRKAIVPTQLEIKHVFLSTYSASTFVRRRVFDDGFALDHRLKAVADADWILRLLEAGFRAGVLNEPLATFLQDGENMGQSEQGRAEAIRWRRHDTLRGKFYKWGVGLLFRYRRLWNGCYRSRKVEVEVYRGGGGIRSKICAKVGGRWKAG